MAFDRKDWLDRLARVKTQEEFTALMDELPESMLKADPASSITAQKMLSTPLILNTRKGMIEVG